MALKNESRYFTILGAGNVMLRKFNQHENVRRNQIYFQFKKFSSRAQAALKHLSPLKKYDESSLLMSAS